MFRDKFFPLRVVSDIQILSRERKPNEKEEEKMEMMEEIAGDEKQKVQEE